MRQWKKVLIKDLGRIVTGHTPPTKEKKFFGDFMPFIKPTDISKDEKYTYHPEQYYSLEAAEKYKSSLIPKGATCVVCIGTIGEKMTMAHCDLFTNQSINSIIPSDDYDPDFVYYLLKYNLGKVKSLNKGTASGREFVSKSTFLEMPIKVCVDRDEQIRIGSVLSHYDSLIENYQQQIKLLEEAAQRLYKEWFVDLHFPGYENTKIVDGVPEGWRKEGIGELGEYLNGFAFKPSDWQTKGLPIIKIKELQNGVTKETPCNNGERVPKKYKIKAGDLIFSWSATLKVVIWSGEDGWLNQHLFKVTPKTDIPREFLLQSIASSLSKFQNLTTGSTMKHIQRNKLDQVFVVVPTKDILRKYMGVAETIRSRILDLSTQLRLLTEARDRLLPKLMSGEIEV